LLVFVYNGDLCARTKNLSALSAALCQKKSFFWPCTAKHSQAFPQKAASACSISNINII
jgi:hypothetical protein